MSYLERIEQLKGSIASLTLVGFSTLQFRLEGSKIETKLFFAAKVSAWKMFVAYAKLIIVQTQIF